MNIFYVDSNPTVAAQSLCNRHVVKMISESANILLWKCKKEGYELPLSKSGTPVKLSHENHPATKWALESWGNYKWLYEHLFAMLFEYYTRYKQKHFCETYMNYLYDIRNRLDFDKEEQTHFKGCFGNLNEQCGNKDMSTVDGYRLYYWLDKSSFARWPSVDKIPVWWYGGKDEKWVDPSFHNGEYTKR